MHHVEIPKKHSQRGPLALTVPHENLDGVAQGFLLCMVGRDMPIEIPNEDRWSGIEMPGDHVKPVGR